MDHNFPSKDLSTAADVMTAAVISVLPGSSVKDLAKVLLNARISAVPVVDEAGALLGIVSEGDLLGRSTEDRLAGQEWWQGWLITPVACRAISRCFWCGRSETERSGQDGSQRRGTVRAQV